MTTRKTPVGLLNAGLPWSESSIADLRASLGRGADIAETADFLCRTPKEVREKMVELGLSVREDRGAALIRGAGGTEPREW